MTITDLFSAESGKVKESLAGLFSYREYVNSTLQDIKDFILSVKEEYESGDPDSITTFTAIDPTDGIEKVVEISNKIYSQVLDGVGAVGEDWNLVISGTSDTITLTADEIQAAIEAKIGDLQAQYAFLDQCLSCGEISVADFVAKLSVQCGELAASIKSRYANLIDSSGSVVQTLMNFITNISYDSMAIQDQYISVTNINEYAGGIINAALGLVVTSSINLATKIMNALSKLENMFDLLKQGLKQLGSWITKKLRFGTDSEFEVVGHAPVGILDFPVVQYQIQVQGQSDWQDLIDFAYTDKAAWNPSSYDYFISYGDYDTFIEKGLYAATHRTVDNKSYVSYIDVPVACDTNHDGTYFDFIVRIGLDENGYYVINLHPIMTETILGVMTDSEIVTKMGASLKRALYNMSLFGGLYDEVEEAGGGDDSGRFNARLAAWFDANPVGGAKDLFSHLPSALKVITTDQTETSFDRIDIRSMITMLTYALINSTISIDVSGVSTPVADVIAARYSNMNAVPEGITHLDISDIDDFIASYRPFAKDFLYPICVHYQTDAEQAQEWLNLITTAAVVLALIVVTVKLTKFIRNCRYRRMLAQAKADKLSWDVAENPTAQNIRLWRKAQRRADRLNRVDTLFGTMTNADTTQAALKNNLDYLVSSGNTNVVDSDSIISLIR